MIAWEPYEFDRASPHCTNCRCPLTRADRVGEPEYGATATTHYMNCRNCRTLVAFIIPNNYQPGDPFVKARIIGQEEQ